ncbi:MAG: sugar transferase [Candidatus Thiodiazotropha endolucinida]|uniref:Sugar transferase n=1 Tax=Candidatus Thiodiazotropha taylori TaxID=2792791 RepID=A0A9E4NWV8_9GAMM|nr:sugar transferase [Candidatus Thiodiazotropha taylori]MCG8094440.1 sugar transferase [Candidatus Thiodiazotropha endolucinida]MCG8047737.1 sugar transferase [Candidatus Thiodiazotropha taylori]MCG8058912.1 sugar transferase [Candidatus Thiodiazotropha taylori]MCG8065342.1 sugar transferase [Candidatus Thiodiazotropha taylori]
MSGKRAFDLVFAAMGLALFAPLLLIILVLILLEDGAPVVFAQQRIGRHFRPFTLYKLRSMRNGKVTRVGGWLRKTGLDEILQFINVLKGSMSLVGPRPLTREDARRLNLYDENLPRFRLRPGITGMAQLYAGQGFRVTQFLERNYIERQSLCLDLLLVLCSLLVNLFGKQRFLVWLRRERNRRVRIKWRRDLMAFLKPHHR